MPTQYLFFLHDFISNVLLYILLYLYICSGTTLMMGFAESMPDH